MPDNYDSIKTHLRDYVEQITQQSKNGMYVCPICGSGTGPKRTGAFSITPDGLRYKCFSCGKEGDIFDLYEQTKLCGKREARRALFDMYGNGTASPGTTSPASPSAETGKASPLQDAQPPSYAEEIRRYAAALPGSKAESYLLGRGISPDSMKGFNLGYKAETDSVVIPFNAEGTYYTERRINPQEGGPAHVNRPGRKTLFNPGALYDGGFCFVVESPLCAVSLMQCGYRAVALAGRDGGPLYQQIRRQTPTASLVLCLDDDNPGSAAQGELMTQLKARYGQIPVYDGSAAMYADLPDTCKDPNDILRTAGQDALQSRCIAVLGKITAEQEAERISEAAIRAEYSGPAVVDAFLEEVQTERFKPIPTGWRRLDSRIGGGLIRQQLVLLGAAPGLGKTAFAQMLFERMARYQGTDCLYINLEMSREQMLARSLSRMTAEAGTPITTTRILQGYSWTAEELGYVLSAADTYKARIAPHVIYNPDGIPGNLDGILAYMTAEAQRAEHAGRACPIVVIDYLQIIAGDGREDPVETIKRAVKAFKDYAVTHKTIVFVIMAHSRAANKNGDAGMEAGRDSSALEYSADLQMALLYTLATDAAEEEKKKVDKLTKADRRRVTLKITKGRFGGTGARCEFGFIGEEMRFCTPNQLTAWELAHPGCNDEDDDSLNDDFEPAEPEAPEQAKC